ncbi:FHA domain protein [Ancylostoma duodenale]|uniref:FHA domain protein n=1 Tax=Ancylostoma duodenale TaxID=51022 RepID=A0A0C2DB82_9BILA|nr:FHA domain protein [Ancylostoma duodenale]
MERVQVLDRAGKVIYEIESRGSTVSIGRDKKKCGIALAIDAQGVSRIHGSLKWSDQGKLTYSDTSTYGTLVDGIVVKGETCAVRDGSHISVGDVELTITITSPASRCPPASSQSQSLSAKNSVKRKGVTSDSLVNKTKRSKLDAKMNSSQPRQSQISSFFQKRSHIDDDDDCMVLAEDTPQSQNISSKDDVGQNIVSFVSDSNALPVNNTVSLINEKSSVMDSRGRLNNLSNTKSQLSSSTTVRRRKKQSIFDSNLQPVSHRPSPVVLAEDTLLDVSVRARKSCGTSRSINVTCIPDTCEQNKQTQLSRGSEATLNSAAVSNDRTETSNFLAPEVSILSSTAEKTSFTRRSSKEPGDSLPIKKARIFDAFPSKTKSCAKKEADDDEITTIDDDEKPDVSDLLKLVSTGKQYDDFGACENDDEDKGLEIERVVAKLSELVHYADIERPPKRIDVSTPVPSAGDHKSCNFKRFRKARQGRFNASLSSANLSCIVAGNADLVDFRQLS